MKRILIGAALAVSAVSIQAADVGVSISLGQPGFYGRIELGDYPPPQLVYSSPRVIQRVPTGRPPIYLRVRPGHEKNWGRHCRQYNACGERVYFVQNSWYDREYAPRYRERHGERRDDRRGEERGRSENDRGHGRDRNRDR
ncbi:hypothetical protein GCM10027046_04690 [Uliginosibacterium flavum]|uniref:Uncharacterized protein n=1 Tax=Uliginosibacterium flavum TaxID=1396831 RepID=A0ABV2TJ61_9RHOO